MFFCRNFSNLHRRWQRCGEAIYIINSFHEARPWLLVCIPSLVTGTWCGIWGKKASAIIGYTAYEDWWYQLMLSTKSFGVIIWRNMCDKGEKTVSFWHLVLFFINRAMVVLIFRNPTITLACACCLHKVMQEYQRLAQKRVSFSSGKSYSIIQDDCFSCIIRERWVSNWSKSICWRWKKHSRYEERICLWVY